MALAGVCARLDLLGRDLGLNAEARTCGSRRTWGGTLKLEFAPGVGPSRAPWHELPSCLTDGAGADRAPWRLQPLWWDLSDTVHHGRGSHCSRRNLRLGALVIAIAGPRRTAASAVRAWRWRGRHRARAPAGEPRIALLPVVARPRSRSIASDLVQAHAQPSP